MKILIFGDTSNWNIPNFSVKGINPKIVKQIKNADYVIYNLEGPIRKKDKIYTLQLRKNKFKDYLLKSILKITNKEQPIVSSDESIIKLFKLNKNSIVTLANNHIKDLGKRGLEDTISLLKEDNIRYLGAGINNEEASKDLILNNCVIINTNHVSSKKFGVKLRIYNATKRDYGGSYQTYRELKNKVRYYQQKGKKVILIIHGGKEMPKENTNIGIDLKEIKSLSANFSIIHHFHKYIKTNYEKDNIFCLGDFTFRRPYKLPEKRESCFLEIDNEKIKKVKFKIQEVYDYGEKVSPLVSVLICTYNAEKFFKQTIDSAINQKYNNLEILILDNNSKDKTKSIIIKYKKKDKRIRSFSSGVNLGAYNGLNFLIKKVRGKYIAILDHDDIWHPNKINLQVKFLEKNPQFVACGGLPIIYYEKYKKFKLLKLKKINFYTPHPSLMFKNNNYFYDTRIKYKTDFYFMRYVLCKNRKGIYTIQKYLYISRVRKDNKNYNKIWLKPKNIWSYFRETKDIMRTSSAIFKLITKNILRLPPKNLQDIKELNRYGFNKKLIQ